MNEQQWARIERDFDASIDSLWAAWSNSQHFSQWYGPRGADIPVADFDLTVGGKRFVGMHMKTPRGPMDIWFTGAFLEITPMTVLKYTEAMCDQQGNLTPPSAMGMAEDAPDFTEVHAQFSSAPNGGTKVVMTHVGIPAGSPGEQGWAMAFDKLSEFLES